MTQINSKRYSAGTSEFNLINGFINRIENVFTLYPQESLNVVCNRLGVSYESLHRFMIKHNIIHPLNA